MFVIILGIQFDVPLTIGNNINNLLKPPFCTFLASGAEQLALKANPLQHIFHWSLAGISRDSSRAETTTDHTLGVPATAGADTQYSYSLAASRAAHPGSCQAWYQMTTLGTTYDKMLMLRKVLES